MVGSERGRREEDPEQREREISWKTHSYLICLPDKRADSIALSNEWFAKKRASIRFQIKGLY